MLNRLRFENSQIMYWRKWHHKHSLTRPSLMELFPMHDDKPAKKGGI